MSGVRLKICGVRSATEAKQLIKLGVDYAGLNFIATSSRYISFETAKSIMDEFKNSTIKTVGLFSSHPVEQVNDYASLLGLDYVQLHGGEPVDYAKRVNTPIMRAIAVDPDSSAYDLIRFIDTYPAEYFVLDRPVQGKGDLVNIELAKQVISARPDKIFLAGGLNPSNLQELLSQVHPYGIDIAGGVRTDDNNLDPEKVSGCLAVLTSHA